VDIDAKLGRWLAYADMCVSAEDMPARCQPFWNFVAMVLGIFCLAIVLGLVARAVKARRRKNAVIAKYGNPSR